MQRIRPPKLKLLSFPSDFVLLTFHTSLAGLQTFSPSSLQAEERKVEKTEEKANVYELKSGENFRTVKSAKTASAPKQSNITRGGLELFIRRAKTMRP